MSTSSTEVVPTLLGPRLRLRAAQPSDVADRQRCGRNREYIRMVGGNAPPADMPHHAEMSEADAQNWYSRASQTPYFWVIEWQGRAIGTCFLHQVDFTNRRARYAIGIFDATCWSQGFGTEATQLLLAYAFNELRLHRVDLRVLDFNERAIRAYRKAGFVQEGLEREGAWIDGRWETDVCMSILEHEYHARYPKS